MDWGIVKERRVNLGILKSIILGIVQGLSEFLPISSSGHLVLFEQILNFKQSGIAFEVFVHFGTLIAVLIVFRKDIWKMIVLLPGLPKFVLNGIRINNSEDEYRSLAFFIIIGSIPAAVIGILFEHQIESLFEDPLLVLVALFVTGVIVWSSKFPKESQSFMNSFHSFLIGIAQAFAIIPGISRSGSTILTALWLGIKRETAARFSFLLSVPVIFGASLIKFKDLMEVPPPSDQILNLIVGTIAALISGYFAIIWLLDVVRKQKLEWFGIYCIFVSVMGLAIIYF